MKIGLVLPSVPAYSETFFRSKIRGLQANGYEVILFVGRKPNKTSDVIECPVYFTEIGTSLWSRLLTGTFALIRASWKAPKASLKLFQLHRKEGDRITTSLRSIIINSHILSHPVDWLHFGFATMGVGREFVGSAIGAKVAVSFRGYDIGIYPIKIKNVYQRLWLNIDKVHTISNDLLNKAYKLGLPEDIIVEKIPPAIQAENFLNLSKPSGLINQPIRILTVGRMHWKKGGELMLEALEALKIAGVDFYFTWVGNGPDLERLAFAVHQHKLTQNVIFKGKQPHDAIPRLMNENDIYLQYSIQEGFCNSVLEAQAAGKLVIVSDAEGLSENVKNLETGWVVPKLNSEALTEVIMKVVEMKPEERKNIQNAARERVLRHFQISHQQKAFQSFYDS